MPTNLPKLRWIPGIVCYAASEDAEAAEQAFSLLMGAEVAPRKEFIIAGAHQLDQDNIDI